MTPDQQNCAVPGCNRSADYRVMHGHCTEYPDEVLFGNDTSCPFLCDYHMRENEAGAVGFKGFNSRTRVTYPYTKRHQAGGWSEYEPLKSKHVLLYCSSNRLVGIQFPDLSEELLAEISRKPDLLHQLSPRGFECLVAAIFKNHGFEVELTAATRDGGVDIYAVRHDSFGSLLYAIQCKRIAPPVRSA